MNRSELTATLIFIGIVIICAIALNHTEILATALAFVVVVTALITTK